MSFTTTITPNFQVHIPVEIREKLGITAHGPATIRAEKGAIIIIPKKKGILSLAGTFKVRKPIPVEKLREYIDLEK